MGRDENVIIFRNTEKMCNENSRLKESIRKARDGQKLILAGEPLPSFDRSRYTDRVSLTVSKKRTLDAAAAYKNMRVAVHNFASATNPGGGVTKGSTAQEECLCRCSALYEMLNTKEGL